MSKILVIEDTQDNFDLVQDVLEDAHEVLHARTGTDGLNLASTSQPDLILLDMSLPGMDGWEVAHMLSRDSDLASIPCIALTAHAMTGDREKCLAAGCVDYMAKPLELREFLAVVASHLSSDGEVAREFACR